MGLFRRRRTPRFPSDALARLELYARHDLDPQGSGIDASDVWEYGSRPFIEAGRRDRDATLIALHALIADDQGGFATYGAARMAWELHTGNILEIPAALPLIDAGIAFKLARGLTNVHLTGYEMERVCMVEGRPNGPRVEDLSFEHVRIDPS